MLFAVRMLLAIMISFAAPVLLAVNALNRFVVPIAPKLNEPAPEASVNVFVFAALLSIAPKLMLPPLELILLLPLMVVAPNAIAVPVLLIAALMVVPDGLLALPVAATPPAKVSVSPPLPSESVPVFKKLTALVISVVLPSNATL